MRFILYSLVILFSITEAKAQKVRCSDFSTQSEAQIYMYSNGAYWLDRDKDGEACECLLGGSKYGTSKCRKNSKHSQNKRRKKTQTFDEYREMMDSRINNDKSDFIRIR